MLLGAVRAADAIVITRIFVPAGGMFRGGAGIAGSASPFVAGGASLTDVFNAAADVWEAAILDDFTITLQYGWQPLGTSVIGAHRLCSQGGSPNRESGGAIRFNNEDFGFFMDGTPMNSDEYATFTASSPNFGGGLMNTGRVFTDAGGLASGRIDMFSIALHEIGHALGLSGANTSFIAGNRDFDVDVTAPRPFAGAVLPTVSVSHLDIESALMYPFFSEGFRKVPSAADIIANGEISQFTSFNLNPYPVPPPDPIPAPATLAVLVTFAGLRRRRRTSSAGHELGRWPGGTPVAEDATPLASAKS